MMLRMVRWIRTNKLILFLVAITFIILVIPILRYGASGTFFYNLDPDIVYVTNAVLYIKSGIVFYADHPGTPSIVLLSYVFIPLRLIAKFYLHKDFIQWSFDNITFLMYYCRIFSLILFCAGFFIFLKVINKKFKSVYITLFAFLAFFGIVRVENAISVVPENLSIFLTAVWLYFFAKFISKKSYRLNVILVAISAIAVANKFTNLFLLIPSFFLFIFIDKLTLKQKIIRFVSNILVTVIIFFIGILPAIGRLGYIANWVKSLFFHAGIYGRGVESVFDWKSYFLSLNALTTGAPISFAIVLSTLILGSYLIGNKKIKTANPIVFLTFTTLIGIVIFVKYYIIRYFVVDFALIIFCLSYFLSKTNKMLTLIILLTLVIPFVRIACIYSGGDITQFDTGLASRQIYLYKNPARVSELWEYGVENVYSDLYIWTADWSDNVFNKQFKLKPVLVLNYDLKSINFLGNSNDKEGVFDVCWDKAYLLRKDVVKFLNIYKDKELKVNPIPNDNEVYEIDSSHCIKSVSAGGYL